MARDKQTKMTEEIFDYYIGQEQEAPAICPFRSTYNHEELCTSKCKLFVNEVVQHGTDELGVPRMFNHSFCAFTYFVKRHYVKPDEVTKIYVNEDIEEIDW